MTPATPSFRLDGNRAYIPLRPGWADAENEALLMHWLTGMLCAPTHRNVEHPSDMTDSWRVPYGPFGPRNAGYRWQLDESNDWWAEVQRSSIPAFMDDFDGSVLLLAARYHHQPLAELAAWIAAKVGPHDI